MKKSTLKDPFYLSMKIVKSESKFYKKNLYKNSNPRSASEKVQKKQLQLQSIKVWCFFDFLG